MSGLYTFGSGAYSQLGHNNENAERTPLKVDLPTQAHLVSISMGDGYGAVVTEDGELYTWGYGGSGQLGHGNEENVGKPKRVGALEGVRVVEVSMGSEHTLVLDASGQVWSCGTGDYGILGHGDEEDCAVPVRVGGLEGVKVVSVAAGTGHSGAVSADGTLYTWGYGGFGQLGHGDNETVLAPKAVDLGGRAAVGLSLGMRCSAVVTASGELLTFGDNEFGKLGHGDLAPRNVPEVVAALAGHFVVEVSMSESAAGAVTRDAALFTWGYGKMGNLGHGDETNPAPACPRVAESGYDSSRDWAVPKRVAALANVAVAFVSIGPEHSAAASADGRLYTWGESGHGETGHGDTVDRFEPTLVAAFDALDGVVEHVEVGSDHTGVVFRAAGTPAAAGALAQGDRHDAAALQARVAALEAELANEVTRNNSLSERLAVVEVLLLEALTKSSL